MYKLLHNINDIYFLDIPKIIDYKNTIYYIAPNQIFHPLGLFKDKHLKEQKFPTLF